MTTQPTARDVSAGETAPEDVRKTDEPDFSPRSFLILVVAVIIALKIISMTAMSLMAGEDPKASTGYPAHGGEVSIPPAIEQSRHGVDTHGFVKKNIFVNSGRSVA